MTERDLPDGGTADSVPSGASSEATIVPPPADTAPASRLEPLPDEESPQPSRSRRYLRSIIEWVAVLGGALVVALVIKTFLFQAFYIPSSSMDPTLQVGDRVLVNKLSYKLHEVNRGDIIVFGRPESEAAADVRDLIKRVVGLPGEQVEGRDGRVLIDGEVLEEPYLPDGVETGDFGPEQVPEDHVFVMGDNRSDSRDSRVFGAIPEDSIVGRAFLRVWPPSSIGGV